ncbi:DNA repair and recombination protein RAD26 [Eremomyces bilateralis CBS 781.70]|uniref:DNA repair and recombination protein RAD26 n=1 Tax=Eremomyces bilateralis CBS 781.70 TaxID=1392243 RepID=A0A6G1G175_9PEZI|nr:DNA repair and recombination protein RAD26 [Eremomyces bilateralis CBS 781.70]KAF1811804.1 DNA repair and recombination protein RAD26 [Eremomyces bilateralis CBS 781.70]
MASAFNKPFKPPLLKHRALDDGAGNDQHVAKRRRVEPDSTKIKEEKVTKASVSFTAYRRPLLAVTSQPNAASSLQPTPQQEAENYYQVLWRKFTTKKHKTWDGDGVLVVSRGYAYLYDESGKELGKSACSKPLFSGSALSIGGKEIEVDSMMTKENYLSGRQYLASRPAVEIAPVRKARKEKVENLPISTNAQDFLPNAASRKPLPKTKFKNPAAKSSTSSEPSRALPAPVPRHDPTLPGALVMKRPTSVPKGKQVVDVVVDPFICKHLRDHQREGVKFLYECVMGLRPFDGQGAILADEMGLGKTLQTIALLWTLLKQNPIDGSPPVIKKALIVCPVTLINNWRKEFRKWLGNERIGVFVADEKHTRLTDFTMGKSYSIMIVGYEKLRTIAEDLQKGVGVDIVIADEGHRLKTAQNKSAIAIRSLNTDRRVILSGTPIQNDLSEFFVMVDFINPGLLGKYSTFKREFENPIIKARQPECSSKESEKGDARSEELSSLTNLFILRRTAEILAKYLPPKTEHILFCQPTKAQTAVYRSVLSSPLFSSVLSSSENAFQLITILKKVCNSPSLLSLKADDERPTGLVGELLTQIPNALLKTPGASGKLQVLDNLLHQLWTNTDDKVVVVSNYTTTLDILGNLMASLSYPFLRLDGSTPPPKRQGLVDKFNRTDQKSGFVFLLSAKAGGVGLNLIGANRLVLFDIDWNPSTDLQAMARIHRDGQKKACHIYRLLTMGALDEKIYQRQVTKLGLADSVMDKKETATTFTRDELRALFTLDESGTCRTHQLLECGCEGRGSTVAADLDGLSAEMPINLESDDDDDDELPDLPSLIKASQLNVEAQELRIKESSKRHHAEKSRMKTLNQYLHFDPCTLDSSDPPDLTTVFEDDVLVRLLEEPGSRIKYIFSKTSS